MVHVRIDSTSHSEMNIACPTSSQQLFTRLGYTYECKAGAEVPMQVPCCVTGGEYVLYCCSAILFRPAMVEIVSTTLIEMPISFSGGS
jgi:hypothetical protein